MHTPAWLARLLGRKSGVSRPPRGRWFPVTPAHVEEVIPLVFPNTSGYPPYFCGDRERLATATAVRFIDRHRLLAAHLVGQRLALLQRDGLEPAWSVTSSLETTFQGKRVCTDVLDVTADGLVVTSNCKANSVTLYRLEGDHILHHADVGPFDGERGFCHGAKFLPGRSVACATCTTGGRNIYFFSVPDGDIVYRFNDGEWRPKDICFVHADLMMVFSSRGSALPVAGQNFDSKVSLVELDLDGKRHRVCGEILLEDCHIDCGTFAEGRVYFGNQMRDTVVVLALEGNRLVQVEELGGFHFPHGLDVLPGENLMAVTNYGTSAIYLCRL